MKKLKRLHLVPLLLACVMLTVAALAGCGGSAENPAASNEQPSAATSSPEESAGASEATSAAVPAGPVEITWLNILNGSVLPNPVIPLFKKIEELTEANISMNWVVGAAYEDKLNALIAANDLPHLVTLPNLASPSVINAALGGMFWEIGAYLESDEFPNLKKANPVRVRNSSIGGKVYGVYRERDLSKNGVILRKDWLDNLGLPVPTTIEQLYETAKAFTLNDPDGNGKHDTVGFAEDKELKLLKQGAMWFGAPNVYGVKDNQLIPDFDTPEYLEALKYSRKIYEEKLMNEDFALIDSLQKIDLIVTGKAGIHVADLESYGAADMIGNLKKLHPQAELTLVNALTGSHGKRVAASGGHAGIVAIPKTKVKTEAELKRVLAFMDKLTTPEVVNLLLRGIENDHYVLEDGKAVRDMGKFESDVRPGLGVMPLFKTGLVPLKAQNPLEELAFELLLENDSIAVPNPTEGSGIVSPTFNELGGTLISVIEDAKTKFVLHDIDETGWKQAVEAWYNQGGEKVLAEMNEQFATLNP